MRVRIPALPGELPPVPDAPSPVPPSDSVSLTSATPPAADGAPMTRFERARARRMAATARKLAGRHAPPERPVQNAVVVGAGPGGLAAALKLAERGIKVTVLELRSGSYARPHHLNLRQNTVDGLHYLGVYDQVMATSGWMEEEQFAHDSLIIMPSPRLPDGNLLHDDARGMLAEESVLQVRISDVENALHDRAVALGVEFRNGTRAALKGDENGNYSVLAHPMKQTEAGFEPSGVPNDLGVPDLVVVADGANSTTREQLGIAFVPQSEPHFYLGGHVEVAIGPVTRKYACAAEDGGTQHLMATGHARYPSTWISVEVGPRVNEMTPDERVRALCDGASAVLRREVTPDLVSWGAGQVTRVQDRIASTCTAGRNVVLFGDAGRSGDVWTSGGMNIALTSDVLNLMHLVDTIDGGIRSRSGALVRYTRHMRWTSRSWHVTAS